MESTKVVSEQKCPTGHGVVIILSREYPGPEDQQRFRRQPRRWYSKYRTNSITIISRELSRETKRVWTPIYHRHGCLLLPFRPNKYWLNQHAHTKIGKWASRVKEPTEQPVASAIGAVLIHWLCCWFP